MLFEIRCACYPTAFVQQLFSAQESRLEKVQNSYGVCLHMPRKKVCIFMHQSLKFILITRKFQQRDVSL